MIRAGLVLEGGGTRGIYTAGALEYFLENGISFEFVVGISAGASNAVSYLSGQKGRNLKVNTAFIDDWRYLSIRNLIQNRSLFGFDFIFNVIPTQYFPFDHQAFQASQTEFEIVATDCQEGKPVYFEKHEMDQTFAVLRASCAIPLVTPLVDVGGRPMLDGGISDPIAIGRVLEKGFDRQVVVLTRNSGYIKKPDLLMPLYKRSYGEFPALLERLRERHRRYNDSMAEVEALEKAGSCVVIRPSEPLKVDRFERNCEKLTALYELGWRDARTAVENTPWLKGRTNRRPL
jgi:predicted patatin/cPLA2 family phospholipase